VIHGYLHKEEVKKGKGRPETTYYTNPGCISDDEGKNEKHTG